MKAGTHWSMSFPLWAALSLRDLGKQLLELTIEWCRRSHYTILSSKTLDAKAPARVLGGTLQPSKSRCHDSGEKNPTPACLFIAIDYKGSLK